MKTENPTAAAVQALLDANGITYNVTNRGPTVKRDGRDDKGWECDAWACRFAKEGRQEEFDFYTGTGHRECVKRMPSPPYRKGTIAYEEWSRDAFRAVAPPAADVLHSIILDSSAVGQSFESWCNDFGYDTDSRRAEQTYRDCQHNADKLARVFPRAIRYALETLLQDY